MPKSGAERTRAWRERKCTSEVTVQNVKKRKNRSEIERGSIERNRIRASLDGVNNKEDEPATSTSAQPPPLEPISDNLQYSDFPVIQKFHFYRASLRHTLLFFVYIFVDFLFLIPHGFFILKKNFFFVSSNTIYLL
jgi:hypothetical protein